MTPGGRLGGRAEVRFVAAGAALFVLDTAIFLTAVHGFGLGLAPAQAVSRTLASVAGFAFHRGWTFRRPDQDYRDGPKAQGAGFLGVTLFNIAVSPAVVVGVAAWVPGLVPAKIVAEGILTVSSYLLLRLVFRGRPRVAA